MKPVYAYTLGAIFFLSTSGPAMAQELRLVDGERVECEITLTREVATQRSGTQSGAARSRRLSPVLKTEKTVIRPMLNQVGSFDRVAEIRPAETVEIKLIYPNAAAGEQVAVSVEDGSSLNAQESDKKVGIYHLDGSKAVRFSFTTAQAGGLYRVAARREFETRIVQLWVGPELLPAARTAQADK